MLNFLFFEEFWKKNHGFHKDIKQHNCFQHELYKICFLEQQISILKWFMKDRFFDTED